MKFTITDASTLDPAVLADELIAALGSNFGISTAGTEITTNTPEQPDEVAFQAVLDAHVANAVPRSLSKAKNQALAEIDQVAETIRAKYLTSAPLQAATYINKANDALRYKFDGYPTPFVATSYPYVDSEMRAAQDLTAQLAADRIIGEASMYDSIKGAAIEFERRSGKIAVSACTLVEDIQLAKSAAVTALKVL
jgi:hypothetical protein